MSRRFVIGGPRRGPGLRALACTLLALALFVAGSDAVGAGEEGAGEGLRAVLAGEHRAPEHKARDLYRHPLETLSFFGLQPGMTVVELWPGAKGWYTEVLAPFLHADGKLYAAGYDRDSDNAYLKRSNEEFAQKLASRPDLYSRVTVSELAPGKFDIGPEGSADLVLTFRNVHNWMKDGYAQEVFNAAYRALKPGGALGVVEHRADPGTPQAEDATAASGYVSEARVIGFAAAAGFVLRARSEINANPKDTKDHPKGVWTLPPTLALGDEERDKYLAIGESDRMTLLFVKPAR
jgi:predicted methyltransferase